MTYICFGIITILAYIFIFALCRISAESDRRAGYNDD